MTTRPSHKTDLYALGIVYLQLLTGLPIVNESSPAAALHSLVAKCEGSEETHGKNPVISGSFKANDSIEPLGDGRNSISMGTVANLAATATEVTDVETKGRNGVQEPGSRWRRGLAYARDIMMAALDPSAWPTVAERQVVADGVGTLQACGLAEIALCCIERLPQLRPTIEELAKDCQELLAGSAPLGDLDALDRQGLNCSQGIFTTSQNHFERVRRPVGIAPPGGDLDAIYEQGLTCFQGDAIAPRNHGEAVRLFRLAAEGGQAAAQWRLGKCYAEGAGVPQGLERGGALVQTGSCARIGRWPGCAGGLLQGGAWRAGGLHGGRETFSSGGRAGARKPPSPTWAFATRKGMAWSRTMRRL